jgi:hypothetical protein
LNDLDKQIATLKGYSPLSGIMGEFHWGFPALRHQVKVVVPIPVKDLNWSASDARALELVDELVRQNPNRPRDIGFALYYEVAYPMGSESVRIIQWQCSFYEEDGNKKIREIAHAMGFSRPESICRAYIAVRERMATKADPVVKMGGAYFDKDGTLKRNPAPGATKAGA